MNPDSGKNNNHHPKLWLKPSVAALVFLIIFSFFASVTHRVLISRNGFLADVLPRVLVDLTNNNRVASNLGVLKTNLALEEAARMKALDMAEKSYFAHFSPEGLTPWSFITNANYDFLYAGENLAVYFSDSEDVVNAWMKSPLHRENILSHNFTEIGIATARGVYKGKETIFVVQMFGSPNPNTVNNPPTVPSSNQDENSEIPISNVSTNVVPAPPRVLGIATHDTEDQTFLAVQNITDSPNLTEEDINEIEASGFEDKRVAGESVVYTRYSNPKELIFSSPSMLLMIVYVTLVVVIIFLMFTALLFELRQHHYLHILCGLGLLVLILVMYFVYQSFFGGSVEIATI